MHDAYCMYPVLRPVNQTLFLFLVLLPFFIFHVSLSNLLCFCFSLFPHSSFFFPFPIFHSFGLPSLFLISDLFSLSPSTFISFPSSDFQSPFFLFPLSPFFFPLPRSLYSATLSNYLPSRSFVVSDDGRIICLRQTEIRLCCKAQLCW